MLKGSACICFCLCIWLCIWTLDFVGVRSICRPSAPGFAQLAQLTQIATPTAAYQHHPVNAFWFWLAIWQISGRQRSSDTLACTVSFRPTSSKSPARTKVAWWLSGWLGGWVAWCLNGWGWVTGSAGWASAVAFCVASQNGRMSTRLT